MTTEETPGNARFGESNTAVPIDELPLGSRCRIVAVDEKSENLLRLMEMGLVPGAELVIERAAPLRSPYCLRLPGTLLAVRADDAHRILALPLAPIESPAAL